MSNKPSRQKPSGLKSANPLTPAPASAVNRQLLIIGIVAVAVVALIVALVVALTGGDDDASGDTDVTIVEPLFDFGSVAISGDPLPTIDRDAGVTGAASVGLQAPIVAGTDFFGDPTLIDAEVNGPTLVVLLAHWCDVCNREVPELNAWRDSGAVPEWLNVVGVGTAALADRPNFPPGEWLQRMDWQWPVLADVDFGTDYERSAMNAFGTGAYPGFVLIDGNGTVVWKDAGAIPTADLSAVIAAAFPDGPGEPAGGSAAAATPSSAGTASDATAAAVAGSVADSEAPATSTAP